MSVEFVNSLWLVEIILCVGVLYGINWSLKKFVHRHRAKANETEGWQGRLDQIVVAPMRSILWIVGIAYVAGVLGDRFDIVPSSRFLIHGRNAGIILALGWMGLRWKQVMLAHLLATCATSREKHDPATIKLIFKVITAAIFMLVTLVMLQIFGVNIMPLLAFSGIGAAAIGFAAKDVIANFFGGFMLFANRPFTEGDEIYLNKEGIEGIVEKIGWYTTVVRDKNKCPVYLPNALFSTILVMNRSRRSHQYIEETIDICYEDAERIPMLTEELRRVVAAHQEIDAEQPILIGVDALGEHAFRISLKMYTTTLSGKGFTSLRQEMLLLVQTVLKRADFEKPLPTHAVALIPASQGKNPAFP